MPPKKNPLKLNALQLKTLTLFQALANDSSMAWRDEDSGDVVIGPLPQPHGNHFHIGAAVVMTRDASGMRNAGVWRALERKGLARGNFPHSITLTPVGQTYQTGLSNQILHHSDH
ncbi:MAG: hypothetical protein AAF530_02135 [Pseudomonadota bacterium]